MIKRLWLILLTFVAMLAAASCQLRPLEDPEDNIELKVVIELKTVLNINTSVYNSHIPTPKLSSTMFRVLFYDPETGKLVNQAFLTEPAVNSQGKECLGGSVNIQPGTYDMICYNFDVPDTYIRGESDISTLQAYTNAIPGGIKSKSDGEGETKAKAGENEDILYEPDHVIVARDIGLKITPHTGLLVIETEATTIVDTYYIQVKCEGVQYATSASAVLSGLSPSNHFGLAQRDEEEPCSVYFALQKSVDDNIKEGVRDVLCTTFNTFGKIYHEAGDTKTDSSVSITFTVSNGSKVYDYDFDLNDIFLTEDAIERHWLLIDKTIVVPAPDPGPVTGGGGFNPEVGEWEEEHGSIVI